MYFVCCVCSFFLVFIMFSPILVCLFFCLTCVFFQFLFSAGKSPLAAGFQVQVLPQDRGHCAGSSGGCWVSANGRWEFDAGAQQWLCREGCIRFRSESGNEHSTNHGRVKLEAA